MLIVQDELFGRLKRGFGDMCTAHETSHFMYVFLIVESGNGAYGSVISFGFMHLEMHMSLTCDLRLVGNGYDLTFMR